MGPSCLAGLAVLVIIILLNAIFLANKAYELQVSFFFAFFLLNILLILAKHWYIKDWFSLNRQS